SVFCLPRFYGLGPGLNLFGLALNAGFSAADSPAAAGSPLRMARSISGDTLAGYWGGLPTNPAGAAARESTPEVRSRSSVRTPLTVRHPSGDSPRPADLSAWPDAAGFPGVASEVAKGKDHLSDRTSLVQIPSRFRRLRRRKRPAHRRPVPPPGREIHYFIKVPRRALGRHPHDAEPAA